MVKGKARGGRGNKKRRERAVIGRGAMRCDRKRNGISGRVKRSRRRRQSRRKRREKTRRMKMEDRRYKS